MTLSLTQIDTVMLCLHFWDKGSWYIPKPGIASLVTSKLVALILPPDDLHLILEKLISKNEVRQTPFLVYFKLDLTACVACKIQVSNRSKLDFIELHLLKSIFQKSSADQQGACLMTHNFRVSVRNGKKNTSFWPQFWLPTSVSISQHHICCQPV